ncbi:MAG: hypothetical protein V2J55_20130 [Candidatus Competibacteraceae bacterium]|jgi:hypothetical protein|nr:hypothetical protein [Candidatus Competibacteraceae bacterium]
MTQTSTVNPDPYWANLPESFDSEIKQRCFEDLRAYYTQLCDRLNALPFGEQQRINLMVEINGVLGAIRSLTEADDEQVAQSHAQFLQAAEQNGLRGLSH